jgi:hypothetical protein
MANSGTDITRETLACFIIDDPILKPQYGCLSFEKLLREMKAHNFFTELAFIPWNYKKSEVNTVKLFSDNPNYFAICVHGCNHTSQEFGRGDYTKLRSLASTALWRMEEHKKLTGLPYEPVFVFPQGFASTVAIHALKDVGFFAAFNSNLQMADENSSPPAIEFQRPATTIYHNFPLFLRRDPKSPHFAQDLEWNRPILIYAHHYIFRDGYKTITDLVDRINSLGKIKWVSLLNIAEHYMGKKAVSTVENAVPYSSSLWFNAKVILRRYLSEVRDNYVEKSNLLNNIYTMIRTK